MKKWHEKSTDIGCICNKSTCRQGASVETRLHEKVSGSQNLKLAIS
jgi:hypothetical protein